MMRQKVSLIPLLSTWPIQAQAKAHPVGLSLSIINLPSSKAQVHAEHTPALQAHHAQYHPFPRT